MPAMGSDCLFEAEMDDPMPATSSALSLALPAARIEAFEARCDAFGLVELVIEIQPRQQLDAQLLIQHPQAGSARVQVGGQAPATGWLQIDPESRQQADRSSHQLRITAGADLVPGDRRELQLQVSLGDGQLDREIPVTLIVQQETPLFRSRFEVDPVLGQFSYRLPPPRAPSADTSKTLILAALGD